MAIYYNYKDHWDIQNELKADYEKGYDWIYKLNCHYCNKEFYSKNHITKYCSYRCRNNAQMERRKQRNQAEKIKKCINCNGTFKAKRADTKYCSNACKQKYYRKNKSVTNNSLPKIR